VCRPWPARSTAPRVPARRGFRGAGHWGGEGAGDALVGVVVLAVDAVGVDPQEDGNAVAGAGATSVTARECAIRGCPATARPAPPAPAAARYPGPPRSPCSCSPGLGRRASPGVPRPASPPGSHPRGRMPSETRTTELPHTLMAAISRLLLSPARLNIVLQAVSCISLGVRRKVQIGRRLRKGARRGLPVSAGTPEGIRNSWQNGTPAGSPACPLRRLVTARENAGRKRITGCPRRRVVRRKGGALAARPAAAGSPVPPARSATGGCRGPAGLLTEPGIAGCLSAAGGKGIPGIRPD